MMKRSYDTDPAWSRTGNNTKRKRKMCSRASLRLLSTLIRKKRAADKHRGSDKTVCVTRTVELPSTQTVGNEKNKLLFMLALGLLPSSNTRTKPRSSHPTVSLERLDPEVEAEAKARTKEIIFKIFQRRKLESLQKRASYTEPTFYPSVLSEHHHDDSSPEIVDLISSDDESCDEEIQVNATYSHVKIRQSSHDSDESFYNAGNFRIITSSIPRKPVFKPLLNNQDSGVFRNWKPESMSRLMSNNGTTPKDDSVSLKGSQSKLLSSLKSIPASTLTVRKFANSLSTGGSCKSHVHGAREDATSSTSVSNLDFIVPETHLITID